MRTKEPFTLLLIDIFGELAMSIKLAGEGYIKNPFRELRVVLGLIFAGLFTAASWPEASRN